MEMDEVIRAIERMDAGNMQDVLNAVRKRHDELFPLWSFVILSLPKNSRETWKERIEQAISLEEKCHKEQ